MQVTSEVVVPLMAALARIDTYCGHNFAVTPVSNTLTRQLAKMGWVEIRRTKVYSQRTAETHDGQEKTNILRTRMTFSGALALAVARGRAKEGRTP